MGYLRNRLIQAAVTVYGIITVGFFFIHLMPGGPEEYLRNQIRSNPQEYGFSQPPSEDQIREYLEVAVVAPPDKPIWESYIDYIINLSQLDFGISYIIDPGSPVMPLIAEAAPWTILLSSISLVYGLVASIVFGTVMAYYEGSKFDVTMTVSMIFNAAVPYYVAAILLLYFFGYQMGWFPTSGRFNPDVDPGYNVEFVASVFYHAALPSLSMIVTGFGAGALNLRAHSIRVLGSDHIKVARLRGLSTYTISTRYLGRNAILPMYTSILVGLGGILGGSVILEAIFGYRGMGLLMFEATIARDFPVLTASLILTSLLFVLGTLLADFTYALVDPRAEQASMG